MNNPVCQDQEYKPVLLAFLSELKYLDFRLVKDTQVASDARHPGQLAHSRILLTRLTSQCAYCSLLTTHYSLLTTHYLAQCTPAHYSVDFLHTTAHWNHLVYSLLTVQYELMHRMTVGSIG